MIFVIFILSFAFSFTNYINCYSHQIRVLLNKQETEKTFAIKLNSDDSFILKNPKNRKASSNFKKQELIIVAKNNTLYLKCQDNKYRKIKQNEIEIYSPSNKIIYDNITYQGNMHICLDKTNSSVLIINKLNLNDYLYSVIRHEGIPSWPMEVHKVQAIASRSFALYHMKQARTKKTKSYYDIKNTTHCQVYKGFHNQKHLLQAIKETDNMILTYKKDIAIAMFDTCCGGIISANLHKKDESKPYLYRKQPCHYCKITPRNYTWQKVLSKKKVLELLKAHPKSSKKLHSFGSTLVKMQVIDKDRAGIVRKVKCSGKRHSVILGGHEIKSALGNNLKSAAFTIKQDNNNIIFDGRGNSHFKGLCQWGAKNLVDKGWNYKKILQFYYPETNLSYIK